MCDMPEQKNYLILTDSRFAGAASAELRRRCQIKVAERSRYNDITMMVAELSSKNDAVSLLSARFSFIDFMMPIDVVLLDVTDTEMLHSPVFDLVKSIGLRDIVIEIKKIYSNVGGNAKSIEVELGERLEQHGIYPNLVSPKSVIYIVLIGNNAFIGHTVAENPQKIDHFRFASKIENRQINRAEFKLREAINYFNINLKGIKACLDIGAAPGGWTHLLLQNSLKVVAVDYSDLDYSMMEGKRILVLAESKDTESVRESAGRIGVEVAELGKNINTQGFDLVHLKSHIDRNDIIPMLSGLWKFDLLCIDVNSATSDVIPLAAKLSSLLSEGAILLVTAKLSTDVIEDHVKDVMVGLSKNYCEIQIKKLPHNRMEFTVFAVVKPVYKLVYKH